MTAPLSVARLPPRRRRRLGLGVLVVLFALLLVLFNLVPLAAEWLWFQAVGYERVFTTRLVAEAVLGVGVGGLVFVFLYVNLRIAQRGLVPNPLVVQVSSAGAAVDVTRLLRRLALPTSLGLALVFGLGAAGGWLGVLQLLHRTSFGVTDPVFGRDVGYYVFTVPVIAGVIGLVIAVTTLTLLATVGLYALRRDIVVFRRQVTVEPSARLHLGVLIALLYHRIHPANPWQILEIVTCLVGVSLLILAHVGWYREPDDRSSEMVSLSLIFGCAALVVPLFIASVI